MNEESLDSQAAPCIYALAEALARQPGIQAERLRLDFLDCVIEGIKKGPGNAGTVASAVAGAIDLGARKRATD